MAKKRPKTTAPKQVQDQKESSSSDCVDENMIYTKSSTVLAKVCRLCQSKDGPFLNIFDADTMIIKKIDDIMPFQITENDDLPHKICFRCSAKVEELYEFMRKCVKTQENLRTELGKKSSLHSKTKTRLLWEKKLDQSNMSNDDICNALIKKAMESIKDIPLNPLPAEEENSSINKHNKPSEISISKKDAAVKPNKAKQTDLSEDDRDEVSLKQVKLTIEKCDDKVISTRSSRSNKMKDLLEGLPEITMKPRQYSRKSLNNVNEAASVTKNAPDDSKKNPIQNVIIPINLEKKKEDSKKVDQPKAPEPSPINIMDYVSIIKVNDVGTLYMCKLCSRNFLSKEVVYSHGCAKNNVPKDNISQNTAVPPQIPKPSTVKYIKTHSTDNKQQVTTEKKQPSANADNHADNIRVQSEVKSKPRIGPASRINRTQNQTPTESTPSSKTVPTTESNSATLVPTVNFPGIPSLSTRYKLVPGPNNVFTLIEDSTGQNESENSKKRTLSGSSKTYTRQNYNRSILASNQPQNEPEVFDIEDDITPPQRVEQPYPVGLFQTVPHHSGMFGQPRPTAPPTFSTSALKKNSYTVVQTGNPSKLLISAKPQHQIIDEEPAKKKPKKAKPEVSTANNVSLDDTSSSKNPGFFTFINVDPLLQPSYVLPTDNIIQESQISTSTPVSKVAVDNEKDNKYECNMCNEKFSREKKLLAHIQSHYNQMDEEDQIRAEKTTTNNKRKTRKS